MSKYQLAGFTFITVLLLTDIITRWYTYNPRYIRVEVPKAPEDIAVDDIKAGFTAPDVLIEATVQSMKQKSTRWMNPALSAMDLDSKVWLNPEAVTKIKPESPYLMKITKSGDSFRIIAPLTHKWKPADLTDGNYEGWWGVTSVEVWDPKNLKEVNK